MAYWTQAIRTSRCSIYPAKPSMSPNAGCPAELRRSLGSWLTSRIGGHHAATTSGMTVPRFTSLQPSKTKLPMSRALRGRCIPEGTRSMGICALEGPQMCSGLPVARYNAETMGQSLGDGLR